VTTLGAVVPSHGRPEQLAACLAALGAQRRPLDQVVVALRAGDEASARVAADHGAFVVTVDEPGVLAAMVEGVRALSTDVVCFTDDDALAPPEWTERLLAHLASSTLVGGVGGRDVLADAQGRRRDEPTTPDVGRLTWYGRHVGNHHLGEGPVREVAFLKGVDCAYRRTALALPVGLRGTGAQVHFEVAVGRAMREDGWRLLYDPAAWVEHRPAERLGADQRDAPSATATSDAAYNLVVALGGWRGLVRAAWALVVGDRGCPGALRGLAALVGRDAATRTKVLPSMRGTGAGAVAILRRRGVAYVRFS
jgi:GT2 family glycosyltransferase